MTSRIVGWVRSLTWLFRLQFLIALAIFTYFALATDPTFGAANNDKIWHFVGNMLFFLSARLAVLRLGNIWFVLGFVLLYGAAMELAQNLVPQRVFDLRDLLANALGVISGLAITLIIQWLWNRLQSAAVAADDHAPP